MFAFVLLSFEDKSFQFILIKGNRTCIYFKLPHANDNPHSTDFPNHLLSVLLCEKAKVLTKSQTGTNTWKQRKTVANVFLIFLGTMYSSEVFNSSGIIWNTCRDLLIDFFISYVLFLVFLSHMHDVICFLPFNMMWVDREK